VQADLEAAGYEVIPFILPACGVNAPHRRDRVWFVAYRSIESIKQDIERGRQKCSGEWTEMGCINTTISEKRITPNTRLLGQEIGQINTMGADKLCKESDVAHTDRSIGCEGRLHPTRSGQTTRHTGTRNSRINECGTWDNFPTQPPVRCGNDELPGIVVRNIKPEIYGQISERYTDEDLQEVWKAVQPEDVQQKIRGLYKIHEPGILFQVMQLCSPTNQDEKGVSAFSEITSEKLLRKLRKYGTFANSPQGRKLEKQFREQFGNTLPFLSHEVALVAVEVERRAKAFATWHRNESIKAYGNSVVPQVVYQIFKAIEEYEISR